jgi:hypothetical protein
MYNVDCFGFSYWVCSAKLFKNSSLSGYLASSGRQVPPKVSYFQTILPQLCVGFLVCNVYRVFSGP